MDWSIIWQQRTRSKWFPLKVFVIYFALCEPEARACDEYDLSSFWKENWFSSCETSTEKWNTGRKPEERKKKGGMKTLLAASATGIHQCLSRQLPWVGNELVSSVCVLKQARGTLILPNQELCWHIPFVVSLLLFYPLLETERQSQLRHAGFALLLTIVNSADRSRHSWCQVCGSVEAHLFWIRSLFLKWQAMHKRFTRLNAAMLSYFMKSDPTERVKKASSSFKGEGFILKSEDWPSPGLTVLLKMKCRCVKK